MNPNRDRKRAATSAPNRDRLPFMSRSDVKGKRAAASNPNRDRKRAERTALKGKDRFLTGALRKEE